MDAQPASARGEHADPRAGLDHGLDERGHGVDDVFAVVDHEEEPLANLAGGEGPTSAPDAPVSRAIAFVTDRQKDRQDAHAKAGEKSER